MTNSDYKSEINAFLVDHIRKQNIGDDEDIFAGGFVTSMFAMELVLFIESQFGIQLGNQDLKLDNFRTVNQMVALIECKLSA